MTSQGSGTVTAALSRVETYNSAAGGIVVFGASALSGSLSATVTDSVASGGTYGFYSRSDDVLPIPTILAAVRSVSAYNTNGLYAQGSAATIRLAESTVMDNPGAGWQILSATIESFGDNNVRGNGANTGSLTTIPKQ